MSRPLTKLETLETVRAISFALKFMFFECLNKKASTKIQKALARSKAKLMNNL